MLAMVGSHRTRNDDLWSPNDSMLTGGINRYCVCASDRHQAMYVNGWSRITAFKIKPLLGIGLAVVSISERITAIAFNKDDSLLACVTWRGVVTIFRMAEPLASEPTLW